MLCELMLQGLEAQPLGLGSFIAEATAVYGYGLLGQIAGVHAGHLTAHDGH